MEKRTSKDLDESIEEMKEYLEEDPNLDREMERRLFIVRIPESWENVTSVSTEPKG